MVQHLADRLADRMERAAAAGAGIGVEIQRHLLAHQMIGEGEAVLRSAPERRLAVGGCRQASFRSRDVGVEIFQTELELIAVEAFGTAPEAAALQRLDDLPEPIDLGLCLGPLTVERRRQLADHPMQRRDVIRQGSEVYVHERILGSSARSTECYRAGESIGRSAHVIRRRWASTDARASASQCPRSAPRAGPR